MNKKIQNFAFYPLEIISNLGVFGILISMIIAFLIGTHVPIIFQSIFVIYLILYMNSWKVKQLGLAGIILVLFFILTILALIAGNISWYIQTDYKFEYNIFDLILSIFTVK